MLAIQKPKGAGLKTVDLNTAEKLNAIIQKQNMRQFSKLSEEEREANQKQI